LKGVMPAVTPERHALAPVVDAAADAVRMLALEQLRDAAGELDDLQPALHLAQRIGQGLAVLGGEQAGDVGLVLLDQIAELEHHPGAALRRRRPSRSGGLRRLPPRDRRRRGRPAPPGVRRGPGPD
jgi:hypothetical protein